MLKLADLDGNGITDLVTRDATTGRYLAWVMSGMRRHEAVTLRAVNERWELTAAGDINGDGRDDLLWLYPDRRRAMVWFMDGAKSKGRHLGRTPRGGEFASLRDFDGNGTADLLWRRSATNEYFSWLMRGSRVIKRGRLGAGPADSEFLP